MNCKVNYETIGLPNEPLGFEPIAHSPSGCNFIAPLGLIWQSYIVIHVQGVPFERLHYLVKGCSSTNIAFFTLCVRDRQYRGCFSTNCKQTAKTENKFSENEKLCTSSQKCTDSELQNFTFAILNTFSDKLLYLHQNVHFYCFFASVHLTLMGMRVDYFHPTT